MAVNNVQRSAYGFRQGLENIFPAPIIANRAPATTDKAPLGRVWIYPAVNGAWVITSTLANVSTWVDISAGGGVFNNLAVATFITAGTTITAGTGITATTGNISATAGAVNAGTSVGAATTVTAGTGITSTTGNIVATAGAVNAGTTMTAGTGITSTAGNIVATAGQVNAGTTITAGTGITATTGNIVATAGAVNSGTTMTAGTGLTVTSGTTTINSNTNAANAIYLNANGGVNETIQLTATQGTGIGAISLLSTAGGITLATVATRGVTFSNGAQAIQFLVGEGSPNTVVTANQGSLWVRTDGVAATTLYVNTNSGTAWTALT
jgi:hypothetical protein